MRLQLTVFVLKGFIQIGVAGLGFGFLIRHGLAPCKLGMQITFLISQRFVAVNDQAHICRVPGTIQSISKSGSFRTYISVKLLNEKNLEKFLTLPTRVCAQKK